MKTREEIIKKIQDILFRHRANDRGNEDLNLFKNKEELDKQDEYYADSLLSLFIELMEERIPEKKYTDPLGKDNPIDHMTLELGFNTAIDQFQHSLDELRG